MTEVLSIFVSHPSNVVALFAFLTCLVLTLKSIFVTKLLLKSGKKHGMVTDDQIMF